MSRLSPLAQPFQPSPNAPFRLSPKAKPFSLSDQKPPSSEPAGGKIHDSPPRGDAEEIQSKALPAYAIPFYHQMFPPPLLYTSFEPANVHHTCFFCCPFFSTAHIPPPQESHPPAHALGEYQRLGPAAEEMNGTQSYW